MTVTGKGFLLFLPLKKTSMDKKSLRQEIRLRKKSRSREEMDVESRLIMQKLAEHPLFRRAKTVMLYASLPDEVQTLSFIEEWKRIKRIVLPTVVGDDIVPVEMTADGGMREGDFHILEPVSKPYEGHFDLIVVPGMAFDAEGNRLGRGKGYYDRFLAKHPDVPTIGICYGFQMVEKIPSEPHDRLVSEVITL